MLTFLIECFFFLLSTESFPLLSSICTMILVLRPLNWKISFPHQKTQSANVKSDLFHLYSTWNIIVLSNINGGGWGMIRKHKKWKFATECGSNALDKIDYRHDKTEVWTNTWLFADFLHRLKFALSWIHAVNAKVSLHLSEFIANGNGHGQTPSSICCLPIIHLVGWFLRAQVMTRTLIYLPTALSKCQCASI